MREVTLFCEDSFHRSFLEALLRRFAAERNVPIRLRVLSSQGGFPRMQTEFKIFLRDLSKDRRALPDAVVVVLDANCDGYTRRKKMMEEALEHYAQLKDLVTYAIPDPHIERWMLCRNPGHTRLIQHR